MRFSNKTYKCGTLEYSFWQLVNVFFWMLWGSLAMTSLGATFGGATKFLFRNNGLSDVFLTVITGSAFALINTFMNPILSTASDRHRSRLGRRIPFILYTAIPVAVFLSAMPFYPWMLNFLPETICSVPTKSLLFGAGSLLYYFFYLFVAILYFYLIPDVIPADLMGRFYGLFRVAGVVFGFLFSLFVYKYIESHPTIVYPATAVFYLLAIGGMCYFVREGKYPPLEDSGRNESVWTKIVKTVKQYFQECYGHKYYLMFYVTGVAFGLSYCINTFMDFFYTDACGMTLEEIGRLGAILGVVGMVSCLVAGFLVDKVGAFRTAIFALLFLAVFHIMGGIFIKSLTSAIIWRVPLSVFSCIYAVAGGRILVEVYPRSRFGMMASGSNLLSSLVGVIINIPLGLFSDFLRKATHETTLMFCGKDLMPLLRGYRFINYWAGMCIFLSLLLLTYFYVAFQRRRVGVAAEE